MLIFDRTTKKVQAPCPSPAVHQLPQPQVGPLYQTSHDELSHPRGCGPTAVKHLETVPLQSTEVCRVYRGTRCLWAEKTQDPQGCCYKMAFPCTCLQKAHWPLYSGIFQIGLNSSEFVYILPKTV